MKAIGALMVWTALVAPSLGAPAAAQPAPPPLPQRIEAATLGRPSFAEDFARLDAAPDQPPPPVPHRWRTVFGYGGPDAPANRALSAMSLAVDPQYGGSDHGAALGINPFATGPEGLTITARRVPDALAARLYGHPWASGLLTTRFSFAQLHGYFEAEMDLPVCEKGAWPAFWLLPTVTGWPAHGEIDVPETVGTGKIWWSTVSKATGKKVETHKVTTGDCQRSWHRYGVLWRPDAIGFYYDRQLVGQEATPADYTVPMYMLVNLAVGGAWPGPPAPGARQITMRVRQIQAWPLSTGR